MNKAFGSCSSKLDGEMLPLRFGFWPKHVACFMEFIFFSYFSTKIFEFSFNPWCKIGCLDAHALGQGVHKDIMKKKYLVEVLIFITEAYSEPYQTSKME